MNKEILQNTNSVKALSIFSNTSTAFFTQNIYTAAHPVELKNFVLSGALGCKNALQADIALIIFFIQRHGKANLSALGTGIPYKAQYDMLFGFTGPLYNTTLGSVQVVDHTYVDVEKHKVLLQKGDILSVAASTFFANVTTLWEVGDITFDAILVK